MSSHIPNEPGDSRNGENDLLLFVAGLFGAIALSAFFPFAMALVFLGGFAFLGHCVWKW